MTARQRQVWTWSAVAFVAAAALLGLWVERHLVPRVSGAAGALTGYTPDPDGTREVLREFGREGRFSAVGDEAIRKAEGRDTFLYRAAQKAHVARYGQPWTVGRQGIGDCVSWGWGHAIWIALAIDWQTGRLEEPPRMVAVESIYGGSRVEARGKDGSGRSPVGGWSDGSYGAAAARWVRDWGVAFREDADGHDLTSYSADLAKKWGAYGNGGQGDGGKFDEAVKRHAAQHVSALGTFAEAAAAIESGFPVAVCSMQGFASVRDRDGFAAASGSWAHCMAFVAVRYKANGSPDDALLCLNSWGPDWISGPRWPEDMPEGSFWVRRAVVERMLGGANTDSFAVGSVSGFGWRPVNHGDWFEPAPRLEPATTASTSNTFSLAP